jgi:hypothetical protein
VLAKLLPPNSPHTAKANQREHGMLAQHIACVAGQGSGGTARSTKAMESQDDLDNGRLAQCLSRQVRALAKCNNVYSDPIAAVSGRSQLGKRLDRRIVVKI